MVAKEPCLSFFQLFPWLKDSNSSSLSSKDRASIPLIVLMVSSGLAPTGACLSFAQSPRLLLVVGHCYSRWHFTRGEQRGRIIYHTLLAMLLLLQPRVWSAFWAAGAHCWVMFSFSPTEAPQILPWSAALQEFISQCVLGLVIGLMQMQHLDFVEPYKVDMGPLPQACSGPPVWHPAVSTTALSLVPSANLLMASLCHWWRY